MIFHVAGDRAGLDLWVTPNNPLDTPRIRLVADGAVAAELEADVLHANLKEWGWHGTGLCGFRIDETTCPAFASARRVELFDAETNTLLYRAVADSEPAPARVLLVDQSVVPGTALPQALFPHFAMNYFDAQSLSREIMNSILQMKQTDSLLITGGVLFAAYEDLIGENGFITAILLDDPFVEFARRLLWLRSRAEIAKDPVQRWRVAGLAAPIAFAAELDLTNRARLRKAFSYIDADTATFLANPITRHLSSKYRDEPIMDFNAYRSLETLSRLEVVGHARYWDAFIATLFDRLGRVPPAVDRPEVPAEVGQLADALRATRVAAALVDIDVYLERAVLEAVGRQWEPGAA